MSNNLELSKQINPVVHHPSRMLILSILELLEYADFVFLLKETELSKGNLSTHLSKLEESKLISVNKTYIGKIPNTRYSLTKVGIEELDKYRKIIQKIIK
ncbi:MAG: transcriptional regulator [bacterium]